MTTTLSTLAKTGRVQAGEAGTIFKPRVISGATKYPIVACHGAGGSWDMWMSPTWSRMNTLLDKAAREGIPSIAEHLAGDSFGNSTSRSRVDTSLTVVSSETGCSSAKAHLAGLSMGASLALLYAINNPSKVASMTLILPAASIINLYQQNPPVGTEANFAGSLASLITTAWGLAWRTVTDAVTNGTTTLTSATANFQPGDVGKVIVSKSANGIPAGTTILSRESTTSVTMSAPASTSGSGRIVGIGAALPAGADIFAQAAALSGIPTRMYYAPDDTLIVPGDVTALATAIGASATATATNGGGHTNAGALPTAFDFDEWVDWLKTNGA